MSDFGNPAIHERVFALIEKLERDSREMMGVKQPFVPTDYFQQSPKKNQMQSSQQESFRASQGSLKKSMTMIGGGELSFKKALDQPLSNMTPITKGVSSPPARDDANPSGLNNNNNEDFDDDSEGVELMKEQMMGQAQQMVNELEAKLIERIKTEIMGVHSEHDKFRTYIEKRVGEQHSYTNELKDEMDRIADRLKAN